MAGASFAALVAGGHPATARQVNSSPSALPSVAAPQQSAAAQTAQAAQQAARRGRDSLARTTQALQAMRAAQAAARTLALAVPTAIPDGLGAGGLQPVRQPNATADGLTAWQGAALPVQRPGTLDVTIRQTDGRAVLSWDSFNIGRNTTLTFDQQGHDDWIALNRVVGPLDPATGRRDPTRAPAPSQILGRIRADGTVLVINQNGILFSGSAQVDVHSLIASSLEVGRAIDAGAATPRSIAQRNAEFLARGLLGFNDVSINPGATFSAQRVGSGATAVNEPVPEGAVAVAAGARLTAGKDGLILLTAPHVVNEGHLVASDGQVVLQSGREVMLRRSEGTAGSLDPNIRGVVATSIRNLGDGDDYALNRATGLIEADRGNITLGGVSAAINDGLLSSTTSVSRNGSIVLSAENVRVAPGSLLSVDADAGPDVIPQSPESVAAFKPSSIVLGNRNNLGAPGADQSARIEIGGGSLIRAPGGTVVIGSQAGPAGASDQFGQGASRIYVDSGATIDVAGLKDVPIPVTRNQLELGPLKGNELANSPLYRNSFLNGATIFVDPRRSGVRADGVAWIGSPLVDAASFYAQVGIGVGELMTRGGTVTLGAQSFSGLGDAARAPDIIVRAGAAIDISGGWVHYQGGRIKTTRLATADGGVVDIGDADPSLAYAGLYGTASVSHGRWGVTESRTSRLTEVGRPVADYTEGRDAGSLTVKASAVGFDGTLYGDAFAGDRQRLDGGPATATAGGFGDARKLQAANSQRPSGGAFYLQALTGTAGGADLAVVAAAEATALPAALAYGQSVTVGTDGRLTVPERPAAALLPSARRETIILSDRLLSGSGLAQVSLQSSGAVTVAAQAIVTLAAGGVFDVLAGRRLTIAGQVAVPSGTIALETFNSRGLSNRPFGGAIFADPATPDRRGDYDIVVAGSLSARGLWVNDLGQFGAGDGAAFIDGGTISLYAAPNLAAAFDGSGQRLAVASYADPEATGAPRSAEDISGSILIDGRALLDVSAGGRVTPQGGFDLAARGGNLALISETSYAQRGTTNFGTAGGLSGFRVGGLVFDPSGNATPYIPLNPTQVTARVAFQPGSIRAQGFAGGGTFSLTAPALDFVAGAAGNASILPLDFFAAAGFARYDLTAYKTALPAALFANGRGGTDAVLATQTLTVAAGSRLTLRQSLLPSFFDTDQADALRALASGGDLRTVLTPAVPDAPWDDRPVALNLHGLLELHVAAGGRIEGAAGSSLTVPKLLNEGVIRLPGGRITQVEILPALYGADGLQHGVHALADAFTANAAGHFDEDAPNRLGLQDEDGVVLSNAQLAGSHGLYLLGLLDEDDGIRLAAGSLTDLSGTVLVDPRAPLDGTGTMIRTGRLIAGGTIEAVSAHMLPGLPFRADAALLGEVPLTSGQAFGQVVAPGQIVLGRGANLALSGAADQFDLPTSLAAGRLGAGYERTAVWSDGGSLSAPNGLRYGDAIVHADGGSQAALGGTLTVADLVLVQRDDGGGVANRIAAAKLQAAGFDTLRVLGSLTGAGDVSLSLGRALFLDSKPFVLDPRFDITDGTVRDGYLPTLRSGGGTLAIDAGYIRLGSGQFDRIDDPMTGATGQGRIRFAADAIDLVGALLIDRSVAEADFTATGDLRLVGARPWQALLPATDAAVPTTLNGQVAANGDLRFQAARLYPTTGATVAISSTAATGRIAIEGGGTDPAVPLSAGATLLVQAAEIVQSGTLQVPFGTVVLGGRQPLRYQADDGGPARLFAPATRSAVLAPGSVTSVSAGGQAIPYGTTTDGTEWFFAPTSADPLTAPPAGTLRLAGDAIDLAGGAVLDLDGGGDVFAFEFVPGTGGSYDVLSRLNGDAASGTGGLQYPDGRQVYAIVPGLSDAPVAAFDPLYSDDYDRPGDLASPEGAGRRVWLDGGVGVAAGWYTLLPARYALLPGGLRLVEQTGETAVHPGTAARTADGTLYISGHYGDAASGAEQATRHLFSLMPRQTVLDHSRIQVTAGNGYFADQASHDGRAVPRLGGDAGRLVLDPAVRLTIDAVVKAAAGAGGRAGQVDIGGAAIAIVSAVPAQPAADGTIVLAADSLTALGADSLVIGAIRTDLPDGTTTLDVSARHIAVANDAAHPVAAPEVVLAVDTGRDAPGPSAITVADGAAIIATGLLTDRRSGSYVVDARAGVAGDPGPDATGAGAVLRVANGPERLVARLVDAAAAGPVPVVRVGAATLSGEALLLDSTGDLALAEQAALTARLVALGGGAVTFADDPAGLAGLVIGGDLRRRFATADSLTIRSNNAIAFDAGRYVLGRLTLDTPAVTARQGGVVTLTATTLTLANRTGGDQAACGGSGGPDCGTGRLDVAAGEIIIGPGLVRTAGFGGGVALTATAGLFGRGVGGLDVGTADLRIAAPFVGDRAEAVPPGAATVIPRTSLAAGGTVTLTGTPSVPPPPGLPGAALSIRGGLIAIAGARLRATAGTLSLAARDGIALSGQAIVETPGFDRSFGDTVDPALAAAAGGTVSLTTAAGGLDLGAGTLVSVGGGAGAAGSLILSAPAGTVRLDGSLAGQGRLGGGNFSLDSGGGLDLARLAAAIAGQGFSGSFDIRTRAGDLDLAAGQRLTARSVALAADGGRLQIAGAIDTSGATGGDIVLFGRDAVELAGTASLTASAAGHGPADSRQARAGGMVIGTGDGGRIAVAEGARLDVAAAHPEARLVPVLRNGTTYYQRVEGDLGGTVTFRAPLVEAGGRQTVDLAVAPGAIRGARDITVEAVRRWDLGALAAAGSFAGVTLDPATGTVTLDVSAKLDGVRPDGTPAVTGGVNFLGDDGPGTVVDFVQGFDLSASYARLGGLAGQANFQARPGVELDYQGNIVLASNWNLGAGTVDVSGAIAAGLMTDLGGGQAAVVPGAEGELLARFTHLTYRTGQGDVRGAAPVVTLRAGGDLRLDGSLTDGFFQFAGPVQTAAGDGGDGDPLRFAFQRFGGLDSLGLYYYVYGFNAPASGAPYVLLGGGSGGGGGGVAQAYSAAANGPAALSAVDGLSLMVPFPSLCPAGSCAQAGPDTASYRLTAGADLGSVDPVRVGRDSRAAITFNPYRPYQGIAGAAGGPVAVDLYFDVGNNDLFLGSPFPDADSQFVPVNQLGAALGPDTVIEIDLGWDLIDDQSGVNSRAAWDGFLAALDDHSDAGLDALTDRYGVPDNFGDGYLSGPAAVLSYWLEHYMAAAVAADLPGYFTAAGQAPPFGGSSGGGGAQDIPPGLARTVLRTGGGAITLAAAGDINLYDPAVPLPSYEQGTESYSEGGAAIYTAGRRAAAARATLAVAGDPTPVAVIPPALEPRDGGYFLTGGGDLAVLAGGDIRAAHATGPRDRLSYLAGTVNGNPTLRVVPVSPRGAAGFSQGIGTLGGGDIAVRAGGDIVGLTVVSAGSAATAATDQGAGAALLSFGGGDVVVAAAGDLLGGRIDVWSGRATVAAGGRIAAAGTAPAPDTAGVIRDQEDGLRLRLFDARLSVTALDSIRLDGIAAITANGADANGAYLQANVDGYGFYSDQAAVALTANGALAIANASSAVRVSDIQENAAYNAVWPASVSAVSLLGDLAIKGDAAAVLMMPGPQGDLVLAAGGAIGAASLAMLDADPGQLPGYFSSFAMQGGVLGSGLGFRFPAVFSSTSDSARTQQHNAAVSHADDHQPVRIAAGVDIGSAAGGLILSLPKQARIAAGRDIVNMMLFGQNTGQDDITRVVAGRDITATTRLVAPATGAFDGADVVVAAPRPAVLGNSFIVGGPGSLIVEAGRDLGPFLNSAEAVAVRDIGNARRAAGHEVYPGGILTIGNDWNPYLQAGGADIAVLFGVAQGADFTALRDYYVDPAGAAITDPADPGYLPDALFLRDAQGAADRTRPLYGAKLVAWMTRHAADDLAAAYGRTAVDPAAAYAVFTGLPALRQRQFLTQVYFDELAAFADPASPSAGQSARGYFAVNRLFPGRLGYTLNGEAEDGFQAVRSRLAELGFGPGQLAAGLKLLDQSGYVVTIGAAGFTARLVDGQFVPVEDGTVQTPAGAPAASFDAAVTAALADPQGLDYITARRQTGNLDLRLATIQTGRGGDIAIVGPGGRVIAGSTVRTGDQAARRAYDGGRLFAGDAEAANFVAPFAAAIDDIPTGYEGVLTLRGGAISTFTDGDFLLNQSRLYSRDGGDIVMWSSNGDLNAGQGPKTTADVPPVVVTIDQDLFAEEDQAGSTSGAGIAAYPPADPAAPRPNVFLMAPRGTVDAGDAGVRVAGSLFVAALRVVNGDNFQVTGVSVGTPTVAAVNVGGLTAATGAAGAAAQAAAGTGSRSSGSAASDLPSIITVDVIGYGGGDCPKGSNPDGTCR